MSDGDHNSTAWQTGPSEYLAGRTMDFDIPQRPSSCYVTMDDGCRLATDTYIPIAKDGETEPRTFPTIIVFTPYYRRFELADDTIPTERSPNTVRYRKAFVPYGYALVVVDVRGTGASFGRRDAFRSPRERGDYHKIADWIVAQPWSNGAIGATGVSYLGAASDFLLTTGHPAVKAIAPLFAVFDTYIENCYPGGLLLMNRLAGKDDQFMSALDNDHRENRKKFFGYLKNPNLLGPQRVDEDPDGSLCRAAVAEHSSNFNMADFITEFRFKDSALPYDPDFTPASMNPATFAAYSTPGAAVLAVSGWMDGAAYANGSISRFLTYGDGRPVHLLIGPWDHGARVNISPWRNRIEPEFALMGEVLRFFDHYLYGADNGYDREAPIHYFSMHEEKWKNANAWPVHQDETTLYLGTGRSLCAAVPSRGEDRYQVDFAIGTGRHTRYERTAALDNNDCYPDWTSRQNAYLNFTSEALDQDLRMAGHPVVSLNLSSSEADASLFVYLTELTADGNAYYVTEGMLRALHRKISPAPDNYKCTWPYQSMARTDAAPLEIGKPATITFALFPTSWTFQAGSRIRISLAGSDAEHYGQVPHGRPPLLTLHHGEETFIRLPVLR
jgi:putative CocE/NonD family hydrolase